MLTDNHTTSSINNDCILTDEEMNASYNLALHIVSIFVLLIASFVGAAISVVSSRVKCLHINPIIIETGKFFGSGVVLATGFIHMLPAGMEALTDSCLPDSWNVYGAYAGLFAMLAALTMQFIEFIAHQHHQSIKRSTTHPVPTNKKEETGQREQPAVKAPIADILLSTVEIEASMYHHYNHHHHHHHHHQHQHQHGGVLQNDAENQRISTYLLEFGIALHSVLIGITLGTTTESFIALFVALSFHQFFEAVALGAQIAGLGRTSFRSAICMVIFFALTTPVGIAIGIGIHSRTYNPKSVAALLVNGILDSISAGILIYVALVNLISAEMGAGAHGFHVLRKRLKLLYFVALYAGVAAMAVVGRWA